MSTKNINAFCEVLAKSDWDFILEENDTTKAYENFYSRINATADISFPLKLVKEKNKLEIQNTLNFNLPNLPILSQNAKIVRSSSYAKP